MTEYEEKFSSEGARIYRVEGAPPSAGIPQKINTKKNLCKPFFSRCTGFFLLIPQLRQQLLELHAEIRVSPLLRGVGDGVAHELTGLDAGHRAALRRPAARRA